MSARRKIIVSVLVLSVLVTFVVVIAKNREPSHNGKQLSEWLYEISPYNAENPVWDGIPESEEVNEAVLAIGADGLPQMMRWFETEDSKFKKAAKGFLGRFEFSESVFKPEDYYWNLAGMQLRILGTNAMPKIDELHELYIDPETNYRISGAFSYLGAGAVPYLLKASKSGDQTVRQNAVLEFWNMGSAGKAAIPELLRLAQYDSDVSIRSRAIYSITGIAEESERVLPVLRELADDPEIRIRQNAVWAFGAYGEKAMNYIPFLSTFLIDTNFSGRAAFALSQIGQDSIPFLTSVSANSNRTVRISAQTALDMISNPLDPPHYYSLLDDYYALWTEFNRLTDEQEEDNGL